MFRKHVDPDQLAFDTHFRPPDEYVIEKYFSHLSTKTYVVGIQKNSLNETVLLSTKNTCLN